jgi:hypothetical protein
MLLQKYLIFTLVVRAYMKMEISGWEAGCLASGRRRAGSPKATIQCTLQELSEDCDDGET